MFAYSPNEYKHLVKIYKEHPTDLCGPRALSFAQFTIKHNEAGYGYTAASGNICLTSHDPALTASIKGKLWYDSTYALDNSIFAPYLRPDSININEAFKKNVVIGLELASLSSFAEYIRKLVWHRVFKGAMYAKYINGKNVAPFFSNNCPYNLDEVYKDSDIIDGDGFLSNIATPTVNIFQEHVDLSSIVLEAVDIVTSFSSFTNALQIPVLSSKVINIPGSSTVTIVSHVISVAASGSNPQTLCLSKAAFSKLKTHLYCGEFYGGLRVANTNGSQSLVIMNGLVFEVINGKVTVTTDVRTTPPSSILNEHLTDFQFSLVAAEARLNFLLSSNSNGNNNANILLMHSYLLWLGETTGNSKASNDQLVALQARALYLAKLANVSSNNAGVPIPFLKYEAYRDTINSVQEVLKTVSSKLLDLQNQIRDRKAEERQIHRDKALNQNIIKSGKLLQGYIGAQASYQQSLSQQFASVIKDTEKEVKLVSKQAESYSSKLSDQQKVVRQKVEDYKDAVADWQKQETIKAALDIASSLFSLGFAFVTPSSTITALEKLGETVQKIQKAVNVFNAVIKAYKSFEGLPKNPQNVVDALKDLGPSGFELPSSLEWDEMKVNMDATLAMGPNIGAKTSLSAAFSILVLRGKALLQAQNEMQAKVSELSAAQSRSRLHIEQQERLSKLKVTLAAEPKDLDISSIDLVGLTGQLIFFQRQMLMTMASTIVIQDCALQYEYLQPPTAIESFSFISLQQAIVLQSQSITSGLVVQPLPKLQPEPIIYEIHGVKPESITNNNSYTFNISLSKKEFASYNYVRVQSVKAEIGGILSTKSGKYYTQLRFNGQPFFDRGFNGERLTFQTIPRVYTFLNDVGDSYHCIDKPTPTPIHGEAFLVTQGSGDNPFGAQISNITPFSSWKISLPPTSSNGDIKFDNCPRGLTIRLTFQIFAQLKEVTTTTAERVQKAFELRRRGAQICQVQHKSQKVSLPVQPARYNFFPTETTSHVSNANVLDKMIGKSVCLGWDAVFSMTEKQINDNLHDQYTDRVNNPKFLRSTGDVVKKVKTSEGVATTTTFNFVFKAPKLQFLLNNADSAQVYFPLKSGHYEYSIEKNGVVIPVEKADVTEDKKYYIQGNIPLDVFVGEVSSQHNIALKLKGGTFSSQGFLPGTSNPVINEALTSYFTGLKDGYEVYNLGTLDTKEIIILPSLTPKSFKFHVHHSPSNRDILQIFITTTGEMQSETDLNLDEPFPTTYESSLIISSKIFYRSILPKSLGESGLGLKYESKGNKDEAWIMTVQTGSVSGPYPPTMVGSSTSTGRYLQSTTTEDYVAVDNDTVSIDLSGMTFKSDNNSSCQMTFDMEGKEYKFKYGKRYQYCQGTVCDPWSSIDYSNYSLKVNVTMNATLGFHVTGTGQNQLLDLAVIPSTNPFVDGNLEPPAGACECNDRDLQKSFLKNLQTGMEPKLKSIFDKKFTSVSVFALKNILFPAKNIMEFKEAFVPGDMIIFGNFTKET